MKALTLHQPWATLIALGVKTIETRSWATKYRGPLLIHSGKALPDGAWEGGGWSIATRWHGDGRADVIYRNSHDLGIWLPLGAVVAVADLIDCVPIVDGPTSLGMPQQHTIYRYAEMLRRVVPDRFSVEISDQWPYGDFTPGRYGWLLDNVRPIEPVPAKGRQRLWIPDAELIEAVEASVDAA